MWAAATVTLLPLLSGSFTPATAAAATPWSRVMLTDATKRGARCLDGSPGGYFLRRGDPKRWIVFMQGGGWCTSTAGE
jgi:hypothetical protein